MHQTPENNEQRSKSADEHVVKMWTPINIKVDENYKFVSDNKAYIKFTNGFKGFALAVLKAYNKLVFNLKIEGRENLKYVSESGFISVCNHVNYLDCSMIGIALNRKDLSITAIKENFEIPFIRHLVKGLGAIPIPRTLKARKKFEEAIEQLLKDNHVVHFYPEGVLFPYYNGLREFHRGAFSYAVKNDVPIVPLVITYYKSDNKLIKTPNAVISILPPVYKNSELSERKQVSDLKDRVTASMERKFQESDCLKDNTAVIDKYKNK